MIQEALDEKSARRRLEELQSTYGLPETRTLEETFLQRVKIGTFELFMVGLVASTQAAGSVSGAAADDRGYPIDRAFFELLERLSIFAARSSSTALRVRDPSGAAKGSLAVSRVFPSDAKPETLRTSLSNGVALHVSWPLACEAALNELIERDRVLRSFAGEYAPELVPDADPKLSRALRKHYDIAAYVFGPKRRKLTHVVTGMFMFPRQSSAPLVYGFGCAADVSAALSGARREALQRLAFLWGEELPVMPPPAAATPDYHQEFYLYPPHHVLLRGWLDGTRKRPTVKTTTAKLATMTLDRGSVRFVDLTVPGMQSELVVAKAMSRLAAVLRFGASASRGARAPHPLA